MRRATDFRLGSEAGVTLVEMIVAIVVTGILVALASMFGRNQIEAYFDVTNRAALTDAADTALRRIARDLQAALPNSVRVSGDYIEFVPVRDAGRYRTGVDTGSEVVFGSTCCEFDVLLPPSPFLPDTGSPITVAAGDSLVVNNLGIDGANVYVGLPVRRAVVSLAGSRLSYQAPILDTPSPTSRFHIVTAPVTYQCDLAAGVVRRYQGYPFAHPQPTPPGGGVATILVAGVSGCSISYSPGVQQRNGIVSIQLTLTGSGESVTLMQQVDVLNSL